MLAGPLLGAAADRWGPRNCAIAANVLRAVAFAALPLVSGLAPVLALVLVAGLGSCLFMPAAHTLLPQLVSDEKDLPAANSLFGSLVDAGLAVGPLLAAPLLIVGGPGLVFALNGACFAVSAVLLTRLPRGTSDADEDAAGESLWSQARDGIAIAARLPIVRALLAATAAGVLFGAAVNVGEVALAIDRLGLGATGYALLVAANSAGTVVGALLASSGTDPRRMARRLTAGLALEGVALAAAGTSTALALVLVAFAAAGAANGYGATYERTLLQTSVPEGARGRVFGVREALNSWGFGLAFLLGGTLVDAVGAAAVFLTAGAGLVAVAIATARPLARATPPAPRRAQPQLFVTSPRKVGSHAA